MRLFTNCKNCRSEIHFNVVARDRFILARKRGREFDLNCNVCGIRKQYHVNEIEAKERKVILLLSSAIFLFGTIGLFVYLWPILLNRPSLAVTGFIGILTIPSLLYRALHKDERIRVLYFNTKIYG